LEFIDRLRLYSTIFTDPTCKIIPEPRTDRWRFVYDCLETLRVNKSPGSIYELLIRSEDAVELAWLFAALCPWAEVALPTSSNPGGKAPLPFATLVAREGIKANNRTCDAVTGAFRHREEIARFKQAVIDLEPWVYERDKLGMAIRRWDTAGGHWKIQVVLAILVEAMRSTEFNGELVRRY
jgi:tRNA nucleotidyltransferase (CCA-adding enzyme)